MRKINIPVLLKTPIFEANCMFSRHGQQAHTFLIGRARKQAKGVDINILIWSCTASYVLLQLWKVSFSKMHTSPWAFEKKKKTKIILKVLFKSLKDPTWWWFFNKQHCLSFHQKHEYPVVPRWHRHAFLACFLPQLYLHVYLTVLDREFLLSHFLLWPKKHCGGCFVLLFFKQITNSTCLSAVVKTLNCCRKWMVV